MGLNAMTSDVSFVRLRIHELKGRILARRRLAEQAPDRAWHLVYVEAYEAEMRQLQARLQSMTPSGHAFAGYVRQASTAGA
jgi:hypothetical protein